MKVAAVQMCSTPRVADNLAQARERIAEAARAGAELVALPEYFCLMGEHDRDKLAHAEPLGDGPIQRALADAAREHRVWLAGGTLPLRDDGIDGDADHARNTTLVFDPRGERVARYDKIHLFRFDDGERRYDEAATLAAGTTPTAFTLTDRGGRAWRIGLSVCYDLRFPELYRALSSAAEGACDLLLVPAAFTYPTGEAHWELLLRARAVENQCYVLAPAQGGRHENGRRTWGHSLAVGPWGELMAVRAEDGPGVVVAELDAARLQAVRTQLPALAHRRL
ncbi:MAG TPA: carbon-nitrogen hydrolase family protein [Methylibium sp.]|uniref:carbon-nitrogen hydrolase family protein n=1 Tax=Methylibium sp. TaxID=2067992 RepID=UPI002DB8FE6C|nr:carbon-nitrogen hydrolase family protein [Methylibium sp.]HEU4460432.1 carbon-nitrogen hydrolase family protein [Methylibium sp.]